MDEKTISDVMREMGRKGGKVGGKKRMENLSPEERSALAKKAVTARDAGRAKKKATATKKAKKNI